MKTELEMLMDYLIDVGASDDSIKELWRLINKTKQSYANSKLKKEQELTTIAYLSGVEDGKKKGVKEALDGVEKSLMSDDISANENDPYELGYKTGVVNICRKIKEAINKLKEK